MSTEKTLEELQNELQKTQEALEKANAEAAAHRKGKSEVKAQLDEMQNRLAEIEEARKKAEEEALEKNGQHDELYKRQMGELQAKLDAATADGSNWRQRFETSVIDSRILEANAHNPGLVAQIVRSNIALDEKGEVYVRAGEGIAMNGGNRLTVDEHVASYLQENAYLVKANGSGTGSKGGGGSGSAGNSKTRDEFNALDAAGRASFMKGGGQLTD